MSVPSDSRRDPVPAVRAISHQTRARKLKVLLIGTAAGAATGCWTAMLLLVFYTAISDGETGGKAVALVGFSGIALGALVGSVVGYARSRKVRHQDLHASPWRNSLPKEWLPARAAADRPPPGSATKRPAPPADSVAERLPGLLKP